MFLTQMIPEGWRLVSGSDAIFCYHENILHYDIIPSLSRDGTTFSGQSLEDIRFWMYVHRIVMVILGVGGACGAVLACTTTPASDASATAAAAFSVAATW